MKSVKLFFSKPSSSQLGSGNNVNINEIDISMCYTKCAALECTCK